MVSLKIKRPSKNRQCTIKVVKAQTLLFIKSYIEACLLCSIYVQKLRDPGATKGAPRSFGHGF